MMEMTPAQKMSATKANADVGTTKRYHKKRWTCGLRAERVGLGLTLKEVGEAIGITASSLQLIETGTEPRLSSAMKLATFFGKRVEDLWQPLPNGEES